MLRCDTSSFGEDRSSGDERLFRGGDSDESDVITVELGPYDVPKFEANFY